MKIRAVALVAFVVAAFPGAPLARAHHSNVAFYVTKVITVKGVCKEFRWTNPHTWLIMTADEGSGKLVEWSIEGRPPGILLRAGWTKNSIKPGDTVTVDFSPAKDGSYNGLMARVTKADGTILPNAPPPTE
jgi:hypothetical protein